MKESAWKFKLIAIGRLDNIFGVAFSPPFTITFILKFIKLYIIYYEFIAKIGYEAIDLCHLEKISKKKTKKILLHFGFDPSNKEKRSFAVNVKLLEFLVNLQKKIRLLSAIIKCNRLDG